MQSPERWPTTGKEAVSLHEVRLTPLDTNPVFQYLGDELYVSKLVSSDDALSFDYQYFDLGLASVSITVKDGFYCFTWLKSFSSSVQE